MSRLSLALLATLCLSSPVLSTGCVLASATQPAAATTQAELFELNLQKGEILQLIFVRTKDGNEAKAVRGEYFQKVIPIAGGLGGKTHGFLPVVETLVGQAQPEGISIFTFPDQQAQDRFRSHPEWETFKQMRRDAWDQLDVFSVEMTEDVTLRFDSAKSYTIAAAWTQPGTMPDYQRYLDGIEVDFETIGARYIAQMNGVKLQSLSDTAGDPSQLTIVEWSGDPDIDGLQKTQSYKSHAGDFQTAITRFDLYAFSAPKS